MPESHQYVAARYIRKMFVAFYLALLSLAFSKSAFSQENPSDSVSLSPVEGFYELTVPISEAYQDAAGIGRIHAVGVFESQQLVMDIQMRRNLRAKQEKGVPPFLVIFSMESEEQKAVVRLLAKKFGVKLPESLPPKEVTFEALVVRGSLEKIESAPISLKLFNTLHADHYGEWYFRIDAPGHALQISEKTELYRESFVETFFLDTSLTRALPSEE